jgi:hypothetical protein
LKMSPHLHRMLKPSFALLMDFASTLRVKRHLGQLIVTMPSGSGYKMMAELGSNSTRVRS